MAEKLWQMIDQQGGSVHVFKTFPVVIGRGDECDVQLDDESVSNLHVQIKQDGKTLLLEDLGSSNGTFVDGQQIKSVKITPVSGEEKVPLQIAAQHFTLFYGAEKAGHPKAPKAQPAAPSPAAGEQWFYSHGGQQFGPLTAVEMFNAVDQGSLQPTDDVWRPDIPGGMKAFEVAGLFTNAPDVEAGAATVINDPQNRERVTCPYCWHRFSPEEVLYIANHSDLRGDPVLGSDDFQRFLPSRFTPEGLALDAGGVICPDLACPQCHLRIPAALLDMPPLFISIVGASGSGKSYLLASMSWKLRTTLPELFSVRYTDVDAITNLWLNEYEEKLFHQDDDQAWQTIDKTDPHAQKLFRQITLKNMDVFLPLPCMYSLQAEQGKLEGIEESNAQRTLILYDNAGENFEPGKDNSVNLGTRHLIHAEGLLFLFDPTIDSRLRRAFHGADLQMSMGAAHRQDKYVVEMVDRIRKYLGLKRNVKYAKPIIIAISKADVLRELIQLDESPWVWNAATQTYALNMSKIAEISFIARTIMLKYAPEVVRAAESFSDNVVYLPNSALGHSPSLNKGIISVRPADVKPQWAEVPVLYFLARLGLIPSIRQDDPAAVHPAKCERAGQSWHVRLAETDKDDLEVPVYYSGYTLQCPTTHRRFRVPQMTVEATTL
jgi:hypothetical protein